MSCFGADLMFVRGKHSICVYDLSSCSHWLQHRTWGGDLFNEMSPFQRLMMQLFYRACFLDCLGGPWLSMLLFLLTGWLPLLFEVVSFNCCPQVSSEGIWTWLSQRQSVIALRSCSGCVLGVLCLPPEAWKWTFVFWLHFDLVLKSSICAWDLASWCRVVSKLRYKCMHVHVYEFASATDVSVLQCSSKFNAMDDQADMDKLHISHGCWLKLARCLHCDLCFAAKGF